MDTLALHSNLLFNLFHWAGTSLVGLHTLLSINISAENSMELLKNLCLTRWSSDKFPKETPLSFYRAGKPILPPLDILDGFKVVLENMVSYIQNKLPQKTLKLWRLQSPRHFYGGEWNQNGSCLFNKPLEEQQVCIHDGFPSLCHLPWFHMWAIISVWFVSIVE